MIQTVIENGKTYANINDLSEWSQNKELRAVGPDAFRRLKAQIQDLGEYKPLLCTPEGIVLGGNTRLRAYRELGYTRLWVSVINTRDKNDLIKYNLSDNDNVGLYNENGLANLLSDYELNLEDYAVDFDEPTVLADLEASEEVSEDEAPEVSQEPAISQVGQVYQLGRHRLMCGDATKIEDVEKLMNGQKADMVFTDPPYGVSYASKNEYLNTISRGNRIQIPIENDHMKLEDTSEFVYKLFLQIKNILAPRSSYYITAPQGGDLMMMMMMMMKAGIPLRHCLIWVKNNHVLGRTDYNYKHEPILYGWVDVHDFYGKGKYLFSTWEIDKPLKNDLHPTMKPIALMVNAIQNSTKEDQIVADLCGGSGSTLIAAEQTNRTCYMMEIDPKYCDVIRKRYAKFIGKEEEWEAITPCIA
ncbi:MAG TPA: DNA methyltransferase [Clostridia bacterium]